MDVKGLVLMAVIGIVAGWLASFVVGGGGLLRYLVTGVAGAFVGGILFERMGWKLGLSNPLIERVLISAIGAVIVVIVGRIIF
jgi:uncharacterized membrane protein YeaQ/YmgE (transglycosylase-associated protein family)